MSLDQLINQVMRYIDETNIGKSGACHLFRHSMATLMLESGADILYIQHMLGHADLKTTSIYTHVSILKLKEIYTATHPARMEKTQAIETTEDEDSDPETELFTTLAAEIDEEN